MKKIFCTILFLLCFVRVAGASTEVQGYFDTATTWTKSESPYMMTGNLYFDIGANLTIEAGVEIIFRNDTQLVSFGDIEALGTSANPIMFRPENGSENFVLDIFDSIGSNFSHTSFRNAEINLYSSIADFDSIRLTGQDDGFSVFESSDITLNGFDVEVLDRSFQIFDNSSASLSNGAMHSTNSDFVGFAVANFSDQPVIIDNVSIISDLAIPLKIFGSKTLLNEMHLNGGLYDGLQIFEGETFVSSSTIRNFGGNGIVVYGGSKTLVTESDISSNGVGAAYYPSEEEQDVQFIENRIQNNAIGAAAYGPYHVFNIKNNWWGSASGPRAADNETGTGNEIVNVDANILYKPWLTEPFGDPVACCSSLMFLPGLQASRLYKKQLVEDQLWEPNVSASSDIEYLYLKPDGTSKNPGIYTRDIIDRTNSGFYFLDLDIYQTFINEMNTIVSSGEIKEWKSFPYDWRFDYSTIVNNGTALQDQTAYLIPQIESMASTSKTGKVTIITHSNGGLLAKVLIDRLKVQGKQGLIDRLIMVAPPQVGTPKAIDTLLHGEENDNSVVTKEFTRGLGENMKSAYNLLPSQKYFNLISDPVVKFNSSIQGISNLYNKYGADITTFSELQSFLKASLDGRLDPKSDEVLKPNVLSNALLTNANTVHTMIDNWVPPENIDVTQIAGWGVFTTSGIEYFKNDKDELDHKTIKTIDGDETVVAPSAVSNFGKQYYVDLLNYNLQGNEAKHANIMEVTDVQEFIKDVVTESSVSLPENISLDKPIDSNYPNMRIGLHSPVSLDVYDSQGNHTGLVKDPATDNYFIEEGIPGSIYEEIGEGKYVYALDHSVSRIDLKGLGTGTFTLEIEKAEGQSVIDKTSFADIPTTANTEGYINLEEELPTLKVDIEGDGTIDVELQENQELTPLQYLELIRKTVLSLDIRQNVKNAIIKRIDKVKLLLTTGNIQVVEAKIKAWSKKLKKISKKNLRKHNHRRITQEDAVALLAMINELLDLLEQR